MSQHKQYPIENIAPPPLGTCPPPSGLGGGAPHCVTSVCASLASYT